MIQLLMGENDYALKEALRHLKADFASKHGRDAITLQDGQELTIGALPQLLSGQSLFSPQRLVIVSGAGNNKAVWEMLADHMEAAEPELVLVESKPDKRTRTYKWLQKNATIKEFTFLNDTQLQQWVTTTAHREGINLAPDIARFLLSYVGTDQWRLGQEIKKLALSKEPVTQELIRDIIDPNPTATAFELLDAAIGQDNDHVKKLVAIIARSEDPYRFVGLLTSQAYALAVAHAAGERPAAVVAKDAGLHPYVAGKTLAAAKRLSHERLKTMVDTIAQLDRKLKRSGGDPWLLVSSALTKIAAK